MIAPPEALVQLLKPWADYYSHSKGATTVVEALHIGGVLFAGGVGISIDRGTFRAMRFPATERSHHMAELAAAHRWVLTGLTIVVLSGLLLLASDIETFFGSWMFWTKMTLVVLLLANGFWMTRIERDLQVDPSEVSPAWRRLHRVAGFSFALWFTVAVFGVALVNLA